MIDRFKVGIYLRLSRDDDDFKEESQSITNQRDFILSFIKEHDDLSFEEEYIDDGYSGANFERPAFKRMISDIEDKRINCVIVKDQSRLGRNDDVPSYIKKYFPLARTRFIAISNQVDTFDDNALGNRIIGINSFIDAEYCKGISDKVKDIIYNKKKAGLHLGGNAIYGYKKDPHDKYKIIPDEEVVPIVQRIFSLFASGKSLQMICKTLDQEHIPIPSEYKKLNRGNKSLAYGHWNERTIGEMLKNEIYIGNMCQCRTKRLIVSSKKSIRVPKDKWIIVPNTHEPIIDKTTFAIVQNIFAKNSHLTKRNTKFLLKGFLYCKECGHTIGINTGSNKKGYCVCNYYKKYPSLNLCTSHAMPYEDLEVLILSELKDLFKTLDKEKLLSILKNNDQILKRIKDLERKNQSILDKINNSSKYEKEAYMDKLEHKITYEMFLDIQKHLLEERKQNTLKYQENETIIDNLRIKTKDYDYEEIIEYFILLKRPLRKILAHLIDRIIIDENRVVEVIYNFKMPINHFGG